MERIRGIVAFDLDGTVLRDDKTVAASAAQALERAVREGYLPVVVTGRPASGLLEDIRALPYGYVISSNGAHTADREGRPAAPSVLLGREDALFLLGEVLDRKLTYTCFAEGMGYCGGAMYEGLVSRYRNRPHGRYMERSRRAVPDPLAFTRDLYERGSGVENIWVRLPGEEALASFCEEAAARPGVGVIMTRPIDAELMGAGVDKGSALLLLAERLGADRSSVFAAGDGISDIPMLAAAGYGAAVGNAAEEVKRAADGVFESNDEDGFAQALHFWLDLRKEAACDL